MAEKLKMHGSQLNKNTHIKSNDNKKRSGSFLICVCVWYYSDGLTNVLWSVCILCYLLYIIFENVNTYFHSNKQKTKEEEYTLGPAE